ncbi:MAG: hypothetical protein WC812_02660 [Candidatus Pacearchaeota archaeon]|jgi:hypothetical protein
MNNLTKLTAEEILDKAGISPNPEFYSARGATTSDLNYAILEKLYSLIESNLGKEASKNFVNMVKDIPKMSATDFIQNFYLLKSHSWKWNKKLLISSKGISVGGKTDGERKIVGTFTMGGLITKDNLIDETASIKNSFLHRHGVKIKNEVSDIWGIL